MGKYSNKKTNYKKQNFKLTKTNYSKKFSKRRNAASETETSNLDALGKLQD